MLNDQDIALVPTLCVGMLVWTLRVKSGSTCYCPGLRTAYVRRELQ
jgi:hypothetical protein